MKLASGPLKTGTYMVHAAFHPGQYHTLHKDNGSGHFELTENQDHDGIKWHLESLGDYKYRARNAKWNLSPVPPSGSDTVVEIGQGENEWIVKPTDVDGEYTGSPISDPSKFVSATRGEATVKIDAGTDVAATKFKVYIIDEE